QAFADDGHGETGQNKQGHGDEDGRLGNFPSWEHDPRRQSSAQDGRKKRGAAVKQDAAGKDAGQEQKQAGKSGKSINAVLEPEAQRDDESGGPVADKKRTRAIGKKGEELFHLE